MVGTRGGDSGHPSERCTIDRNLWVGLFFRKGAHTHAGVVVRDDEPFENALRRFKRQLQKSGVLAEVKKRRAYDKPSVKKKKKAILARKRILKKLRRMRRFG